MRLLSPRWWLVIVAHNTGSVRGLAVGASASVASARAALQLAVAVCLNSKYASQVLFYRWAWIGTTLPHRYSRSRAVVASSTVSAITHVDPSNILFLACLAAP